MSAERTDSDVKRAPGISQMEDMAIAFPSYNVAASQ